MAVAMTRSRGSGGSHRLARRKAIAFYLFISPWIIGFLAFTAGPMLASLYFSFTAYDVVHAPKWIGVANYGDLLAKSFPAS
jgi:multiple sugar transport system permease protein